MEEELKHEQEANEELEVRVRQLSKDKEDAETKVSGMRPWLPHKPFVEYVRGMQKRENVKMRKNAKMRKCECGFPNIHSNLLCDRLRLSERRVGGSRSTIGGKKKENKKAKGFQVVG